MDSYNTVKSNPMLKLKLSDVIQLRINYAEIESFICDQISKWFKVVEKNLRGNANFWKVLNEFSEKCNKKHEVKTLLVVSCFE